LLGSAIGSPGAAAEIFRGYGAMFSEHIGQADEGRDFDFCAAARASKSRRFISRHSAACRTRAR